MDNRALVVRTTRHVSAAALAILLSCPPPAQSAPDPAQKLFDWLAAVNTHTPGQLDAAVREVATSPLVELEDVLADLVKLRTRMSVTREDVLTYRGRQVTVGNLWRLMAIDDSEAVTVGVNRLLRRAAILHSDVAFAGSRARAGVGGAPGQPGRKANYIGDGQQTRSTTSSLHWEFGRQLLDRLDPGPARDPFARAWYVATASVLQSLRMISEADEHLSRARRIFPDDGRILYEGACVLETRTAPSIQAAMMTAAPAAPLEQPGSRLPRDASSAPSARRLLERAEQLFRHAIECDPTLAEARVRLARLTAAHGRHDEARDLLHGALAANPTQEVRYLALLILGDEEQLARRFEEARTHYEAAAALFPTAQAPLLALGLLARERGDRSAGMAALERLARLPTELDARVDPAWAYYLMQGRDADRLMPQLYALVAKEGK
jgi:Tfp pilus assembly protein PilF